MTLEELGLDKPGFTPEFVRARLHYEPTTGFFTWLKHRYARFVGKRAGRIGTAEGYRIIEIEGVIYREHRLAWFWMTGAWPSQTIDHIDRNPGNNRWSNLRDINQSQQNFNAGLPRNNTSGAKGVYFNYKLQKYEAYIKINRTKKYLGIFKTIEEAIEARKAAETKFCDISNTPQTM